MKLSIIIPVYQVADTLRRCVESVTTDNGTDYEVLLVDDGSTDGSALLCDQLAADNQRISVVHTPNRGLSAARNEGLDRARGEFICFADSDDFVEPGTFNQLLPIIEADSQMDMLEFPVMEYYGGNRQRKLDLLPNVYDNMRHYWLAERAYLHTYAWNKIYRRRLFETVRYEVGRIYEDAEILPRLLDNARRVATTDQGLYYYCDNPRGLTASCDPRKLRWLLRAYCEAFSKWQFCQDSRATDFYMKMVNVQIDVYPTEQQISIPKCAWQMSLGEAKGAVEKIKLILVRLLGVKGLCKLYRMKNRGRW